MVKKERGKQHTFISGTRRFSWSQSTETTGSDIGTENVENEACGVAIDEAILKKTLVEVLIDWADEPILEEKDLSCE